MESLELDEKKKHKKLKGMYLQNYPFLNCLLS